MSGLFQKAQEIRNHTQVEPGSEDEFVLEEQSGISKEDQQEILEEIERVSEESRISVTPETMAIKAAKRGFVFPLLVNIFFIVLLAGGGFTLYYFFQRGETVLMEEGSAIASAEGMLIEELKKESEAALQAKNREINQIQSQLEDIDKQRLELQTNMDEKIATREAELRSTLDAELDAERERLRQQGISEEDIASRLNALETEKAAAFQQELDSFKRQAEEDRLQDEENLKALQDEYQQNLAQAEADRKQVREEAAAREAELRSQLDARTEELEQATLEAKAELNQLAAQQAKQTLAAGQLTGFYSRVKEDIQGGDFDGALENLDAIKEYLDDPSVATLPNMLQRRDIELFVVGSISSLVKGEMQKTEVDTTSLIASAGLLNDMKNRVIEGDELFRQGDIGPAEAKYREALNLMPEINKAHSYFLSRGDEAEQVRRQSLRDFLGRAEAAFVRGDHTAALDNYTKALAYLPEDAATVEKMISQVRRSGYEMGIAQLRRQDTSNAAGPLAAAEGLYNQQNYNGAILGYIDLIGGYPNSSQVAAAVEGVNKSVEALEKEAEARGTLATEGTAAAALQDDIAELEKTLEEKNSEIKELQARLDAQSGDSSALEQSLEEKNQEIVALKAEIEKAKSDAGELQKELEERVANLTEELESKVALTETLQAEKQALEEEIASLNSQVEQMQAEQAAALENLDEELGKKISRLENVERRYDKLVDNYQEYASQEDALLNARGEDALIQSKLYLNAFLTASEGSFPGLWDRIKRYDEAFEKAGRSSAAEDLSDILFEISVRSHPESRELFLESEKARYQDVPEMVDLIDDLTDLISP